MLAHVRELPENRWVDRQASCELAVLGDQEIYPQLPASIHCFDELDFARREADERLDDRPRSLFDLLDVDRIRAGQHLSHLLLEARRGHSLEAFAPVAVDWVIESRRQRQEERAKIRP
jgi:hypothetical protein